LSGVEEGTQATNEQVEKAEEIKESMMADGRAKGEVMEDVTSNIVADRYKVQI